jgi:hypothetical protein
MIGRVRPTCQASRPCNLAGRPSFLLAPPLGIGYLEYRLCWTHRQNSFWKCANSWLAGQGDVASWPHLGSVEPMLCAMSFPRVIFSVTMPYFGHNKDMHEFCSIWCFSFIRCSWNGRSTKLVEVVSNKHIYSLYWMKCMYVDGKYMHFITANTQALCGCPKRDNSEPTCLTCVTYVKHVGSKRVMHRVPQPIT